MSIRCFAYARARFLLFLAVLAISIRFAAGAERGPILSLQFSGTSNDPGWIYRLDATGGYKFNSHFEVDCGLPVYFVRVSDSGIADGFSSKNGIGNAYIDLRFLLGKPSYFFSSTIRGTAPTGKVDEGFSTGRATFDWTNYFERSFGSWTPFGSAGVANTISDTHFFNQPFASLGLVGHFEGGISFEPVHRISLAASGYAFTPSGQQKVFSKLINRQMSGTSSMVPQSRGRGRNRVFENTSVTIGEDIAKDHGVTAWIDLTPNSNLTLELGYNRSVFYSSNSIFFSARFDFTQVLRRTRL